MTEEIKDITNEDIEVEAVKEDTVAVAVSQYNDIVKMKNAAEEKIENARIHLVDTLEVTAQKYLTANGMMAAIETVRQVIGNADVSFETQTAWAKEIMRALSDSAASMMEKAKTLAVENFDQICEDYYEEDFSAREGIIAYDIACELMELQLCQNVGPAAQDIIDFKASSDEEIEKAQAKLDEYLEEHDLKAEDIF